MIDKIILYNSNNFGLFDKGYELYLLDFLNNSSLKQRYGTFKSPLAEAHGEDDANAKNYSIDFKRFITQDECRYRRLNNIDTVDIISLKDSSIKTNDYYDMLKCMKTLAKKDLYNIKNDTFTYIDDQEQKEYLNIVNRLLMKNKNIMLFLPKIILLQNNTIEEIIEYFSIALKDMLEFRNENVDKDLYFTFIISKNINDLNESYFIISQYINCQLYYVDMINTQCSINF